MTLVLQKQVGANEQVIVRIGRSGFTSWSGGGGADGVADLIATALLWAVNLLVHVFVFHGGWTLYIYNRTYLRPIRKVRYRTRAAALADVGNQLALGTGRRSR